jgi:peroxiredoxin Q/BCP
VISPGQRLKTDFPVKVLQEGEVREVPFSALLTRPTIVSVYMKNNTPGCDRQNTSLAAEASKFARAGYNLVAVSRDTIGSHQRYAEAKGITYALVSDPKDTFAQATDSIVEKSMYGRKFTGPARAAYVLGPDGTVLAVAEKVDTARHAAQLWELIKAL